MKTTLLFAVALALAGCVTAPAPLRGEFASSSPDGIGGKSTQTTVRWGGSIITTEPGADQTCIEVLGRELNDNARPRATPDQSVGRFIARSSPGSYLRLSHVMIRPSFSSTGFDSQMASMAGTKVSERMKAKTSAMMTVIAIG